MHCMVAVPRLHRTCCSWAQLHLVKCPGPSHCSAQGCARTNPASTNGWVGRCHPAACRSCGDGEMFHKNSVGEMLHESFTIPWTNVANVPQFNISTPPSQQEKKGKVTVTTPPFVPPKKKTTPGFWLVIFSCPPSGNTFASHRSSAPTHGLTVPPFTVLKQLSKSFRVTQVRGSKVS